MAARRWSRCVLEQGRSLTEAAAGGRSERADLPASGSPAIAPKGRLGLFDRSLGAPAGRITAPRSARSQLIAALRRLRFTAPELAELLDMPVSTVSGILKRIGMGKLGRLGLEPASATSASVLAS